MMIIVNGKRKKIPTGPIHHSALVALVMGPAEKRAEKLQDDAQFEVTWKNGPGKDGKGTVKPGSKVDVQSEQNFTVAKAVAKAAAQSSEKKDGPKKEEKKDD